MNEEDLSALVTSIDENDIEIIHSNGSEMGDQLEFLPEYFSSGHNNFSPPLVSIQVPRLDHEDSEVI